jgi:hypothetical protein
MDAFLKEIRDSRPERAIVAHRLKNHENRIEKLGTTVFA